MFLKVNTLLLMGYFSDLGIMRSLLLSMRLHGGISTLSSVGSWMYTVVSIDTLSGHKYRTLTIQGQDMFSISMESLSNYYWWIDYTMQHNIKQGVSLSTNVMMRLVLYNTPVSVGVLVLRNSLLRGLLWMGSLTSSIQILYVPSRKRRLRPNTLLIRGQVLVYEYHHPF